LHERVEACIGIFMAFWGAMQSDPGGFESRVAEGAREEAEIAAGLEQRGGVSMPQGRDGDAGWGD
jgi:hypothetical protein